MNKNRNLINSESKILISNFISLFILQAVNYLLPLMTLPYLVRVLGVEYFGLLAFATVTISFLNILTDFGFDLTATRLISVNRNNPIILNEIFSSVLIIKTSLLIICFCCLIILIYSVEKFFQHNMLYIYTFGIVIGQAMFPVWLFQGLEKMKYITVLNILSKLIFTVLIFILVKDKSDYYLVAVCTSLGYISTGVLSLFIVRKYLNVRFKFQNVLTLKKYFLEASPIFFSRIAISIYTISIIFVLGLTSNNTIVGYYSAAEKIIGAFKGLIVPVLQSTYPYIAKKVSVSKSNGLVFIRKLSFYVGLFTLLMAAGIFLSAEYLIVFLVGVEYLNSTLILKIFSILPFLIGLSNIFGIQTMLNFNHQIGFRNILIQGSLLSLVLIFVLVPNYQAVGAAASAVIVEFFITSSMLIFLQKHNINIIQRNRNV